MTTPSIAPPRSIVRPTSAASVHRPIHGAATPTAPPPRAAPHVSASPFHDRAPASARHSPAPTPPPPTPPHAAPMTASTGTDAKGAVLPGAVARINPPITP